MLVESILMDFVARKVKNDSLFWILLLPNLCKILSKIPAVTLKVTGVAELEVEGVGAEFERTYNLVQYQSLIQWTTNNYCNSNR